jgi:hypothetical protein
MGNPTAALHALRHSLALDGAHARSLALLPTAEKAVADEAQAAQDRYVTVPPRRPAAPEALSEEGVRRLREEVAAADQVRAGNYTAVARIMREFPNFPRQDLASAAVNGDVCADPRRVRNAFVRAGGLGGVQRGSVGGRDRGLGGGAGKGAVLPAPVREDAPGQVCGLLGGNGVLLGCSMDRPRCDCWRELTIDRSIVRLFGSKQAAVWKQTATAQLSGVALPSTIDPAVGRATRASSRGRLPISIDPAIEGIALLPSTDC